MLTESNKKDIKMQLLSKNNIPYKIVEVSTSRLTLKFNRDGILVIRKPKMMPLFKVELFVEKHLDWIIKNYNNLKSSPRLFVDGEEYLYLGKKYIIKIIESKHPTIFIHDKYIYVYKNNKQSIKSMFDNFRKEEAEKIFSEILYSSFIKMESYLNQFPKLEIKKYVARWGTCYPKKNKISLNISLIHVDIDLIEFVIFHELSHFVHLNHSKEYHSFLKKFVPDETKKRNRLKKYKCNYY